MKKFLGVFIAMIFLGGVGLVEGIKEAPAEITLPDIIREKILGEEKTAAAGVYTFNVKKLAPLYDFKPEFIHGTKGGTDFKGLIALVNELVKRLNGNDLKTSQLDTFLDWFRAKVSPAGSTINSFKDQDISINISASVVVKMTTLQFYRGLRLFRNDFSNFAKGVNKNVPDWNSFVPAVGTSATQSSASDYLVSALKDESDSEALSLANDIYVKFVLESLAPEYASDRIENLKEQQKKVFVTLLVKAIKSGFLANGLLQKESGTEAHSITSVARDKFFAWYKDMIDDLIDSIMVTVDTDKNTTASMADIVFSLQISAATNTAIEWNSFLENSNEFRAMKVFDVLERVALSGQINKDNPLIKTLAVAVWDRVHSDKLPDFLEVLISKLKTKLTIAKGAKTTTMTPAKLDAFFAWYDKFDDNWGSADVAVHMPGITSKIPTNMSNLILFLKVFKNTYGVKSEPPFIGAPDWELLRGDAALVFVNCVMMAINNKESFAANAAILVAFIQANQPLIDSVREQLKGKLISFLKSQPQKQESFEKFIELFNLSIGESLLESLIFSESGKYSSFLGAVVDSVNKGLDESAQISIQLQVYVHKKQTPEKTALRGQFQAGPTAVKPQSTAAPSPSPLDTLKQKVADLKALVGTLSGNLQKVKDKLVAVKGKLGGLTPS